MKPATRGPEEPFDTALSETAQLRLDEVMSRLRRDATLFGDGASTYEAGVLDACEAVRSLLEELDDGPARN